MNDKRYDKIFQLSRHTALLNSAQALLDWDQETYMPKGAIEGRSEQKEYLAGLIHRSKTSKSFAKALDALIDLKTGEIKEDRLPPPQIAALREWRRDYLRTVKLPNAFIKRFAKTTSTAAHVWQTAKEHNDFKSFAPHLKKIVLLSRKQADLLGFKEHPYDALLDLYEPEMTTSFLTPLFSQLRLSLTQLLKEIGGQPAFEEDFLYRHCPGHQQMTFAHKVLHHMGFHPATSRLDTAAHPFCTGIHPTDTRMTTKIHPENILFNLGATMHEGGHGLYHKNLPSEHFGSPLCESVSLGIDESQSRWWEVLIGQNKAFWTYFFPLLQREFPEQFSAVPFDPFYAALNAVKPGFIRIEADEVSYNLHVIVRFEIEKGLMDGSIDVKDIPDIWNEKMREYFRDLSSSMGRGVYKISTGRSVSSATSRPTHSVTSTLCNFSMPSQRPIPNGKKKSPRGR